MHTFIHLHFMHITQKKLTIALPYLEARWLPNTLLKLEERIDLKRFYLLEESEGEPPWGLVDLYKHDDPNLLVVTTDNPVGDH